MVSRSLKLNEKVILFNFQVAGQVNAENNPRKRRLRTRGKEKCQEERDLSCFRRLCSVILLLTKGFPSIKRKNICSYFQSN